MQHIASVQTTIQCHKHTAEAQHFCSFSTIAVQQVLALSANAPHAVHVVGQSHLYAPSSPKSPAHRYMPSPKPPRFAGMTSAAYATGLAPTQALPTAYNAAQAKNPCEPPALQESCESGRIRCSSQIVKLDSCTTSPQGVAACLQTLCL